MRRIEPCRIPEGCVMRILLVVPFIGLLWIPFYNQERKFQM